MCLYTQDETHLVADVNGYFSKDSDFEPMAPRRLVDTRAAVNPPIKVPAGSTLAGAGDRAVRHPRRCRRGVTQCHVGRLQLQWVPHDVPLRHHQADGEHAQLRERADHPNAALAKAGSGGNVCIYTQAATHLLVDVTGWFPADTDFRTLSPERLLDTRSGLGHSPAGLVPAGQVVELQVIGVGSSNIPEDAGAVVLNVTAAKAQRRASSRSTRAARRGPPPATSTTRRAAPSPTRSSRRWGPAGRCASTRRSSTNLVVDVNGWFPRT